MIYGRLEGKDRPENGIKYCVKGEKAQVNALLHTSSVCYRQLTPMHLDEHIQFEVLMRRLKVKVGKYIIMTTSSHHMQRRRRRTHHIMTEFAQNVSIVVQC